MAQPDDAREPIAVDDDATVRRYLRLFWILSGVLLASVGALVAIGYAIMPTRQPPALPLAVPVTIGAVALGVVVAIPILRARLMPPVAETGGTGMLSAKDAETAAGNYFIVHVLSLALCEAVATLGLVLTVLTSEPRCVLGFAAVAAAGMAILRPSAERLRGVLRAASQGAVRM